VLLLSWGERVSDGTGAAEAMPPPRPLSFIRYHFVRSVTPPASEPSRHPLCLAEGVVMGHEGAIGRLKGGMVAGVIRSLHLIVKSQPLGNIRE
jgi:hypothetical protein